ncbi:LytTR family DNA-binding domain-containing protein [Balneola sp. MJW-20]|uniref:LytTR family DNA-binding domain-containing protein n=1 Tax=Gracilimonas aurantiaca TaxID=3234185 RepID=UPI003466B93B
MIQLNKEIPFTSSWKHSLIIALAMSLLLVFIQVFLQPFDTSADAPLKVLGLSGYGFCVFTAIMIAHYLELVRFKQRDKKWFLLDEIVALTFGMIMISVMAYLYHSLVFNDAIIDLRSMANWGLYYALPFAPLFVPLWAYLRFSFSKITFDETISAGEEIKITGQNSDEQLNIKWPDFVLATIDSNYLDIYVRGSDGNTEHHVIRGTLSGLVDQLPKARQIHRSYLVNTAYIKKLSGNSRKGAAILDHYPEEVPVSPKYFTALKKHLQSRP